MLGTVATDDLRQISQMKGAGKVLATRGLYLRTISALAEAVAAPLVIIIDNVQWMDNDSWAVLSSPKMLCSPSCPRARQMGSTGYGFAKQREAHPPVFLFSARPRADQAEQFAEEFEVVCQHSCTRHIQMKPVRDDDIVEIALDALQGVELSQELADLIMGTIGTSRIPMQPGPQCC